MSTPNPIPTLISTSDKLYPISLKVAAVSAALNAWDEKIVPIERDILSGLGLYLQEIEEDLDAIIDELEKEGMKE